MQVPLKLFLACETKKELIATEEPIIIFYSLISRKKALASSPEQFVSIRTRQKIYVREEDVVSSGKPEGHVPQVIDWIKVLEKNSLSIATIISRY